ncbi:MAG: EAL domain-containing protein [Methylophaga sp.]|nr:EAL domain-containing protein [Methylophaga sp.]
MELNTLVVDDSQAMLSVISEFLKNLNVTSCTCVESGEDALNLIRSGEIKFQLIFVDLNMPGMDGMELIRLLSKEHFLGGVVILSELDDKIIQLAADVTNESRTHLIGCMSKPVTEEKLSIFLQKLKSLDHRTEEKIENLLSVAEIESAISDKRVIPYYQPKVNNQTGEVESLELLARIVLPNEVDAVTAGRFIGVAEENGIIEALTLSILRRAMSELHTIQEEFGSHCKLSLNISPLTLNNKALPLKLIRLLEKYGYEPSNFIIEVTESYAIENSTQLETLNRLRIKGFDVALDDYGTGYTNIQQLKKLPYTEIKIDRSLIYNIANDKLSQVVAQSLFNIFDELNVQVVAEGVELPEDLIYLDNLQIPIILQGYIISKPKIIDSICLWHRSWKKNSQLTSYI